jgi:hypothetical protein
VEQNERKHSIARPFSAPLMRRFMPPRPAAAIASKLLRLREQPVHKRVFQSRKQLTSVADILRWHVGG